MFLIKGVKTFNTIKFRKYIYMRKNFITINYMEL